MSDDKPELFSPGPGKKGMTELHYATYCGDMDAMVSCLDKGMDLNQRDEYRGYTALHWLLDMLAADGPREEMLQILIERGADLNAVAQDEYNSTPLILAKESGTECGDKIVQELLKHGAVS